MKSMTGFGRYQYENEGRQYEIEIKTVNHKYSDIMVRIPRNISYVEEKIRKIISQEIKRGKVDILINFVNTSNVGKGIVINKQLAKVYLEELKELAQQTGLEVNIPILELVKLPDVLVVQNEEKEDIICKEIEWITKQAVANLIQMRQQEGKKIQEDLTKRIQEFSQKINEISQYSTRLIDEYVVKLETRIQEILKTEVIDSNRIAQEVVIYADKCSIQEEITRLQSHILQFKQLLQEEVIGKKLDFLIQEMNRETNTIASKSASIEITNIVVDMKTQLEDIREQVQNIE